MAWGDLATVALFIVAGFARPLGPLVDFVYYGASVAIVLLALSQVARGRPADLVEPRRRLRAAFTLIVGIEILVVIAAEVMLAGNQAPRLLETIESIGALWLTALFCGWLLTPRQELFPRPPRIVTEPVPERTVSGTVADDNRYRARLLALMQQEKIYRRERLTIGALARELGLPEYRVRRVINQQLGYRNFNTFVNTFRIDEACRVLSDPAHERLPILNLALDLGFGSLGPFNRAFRAQVGQTPTDYRRARLAEAVSAPQATAKV